MKEAGPSGEDILLQYFDDHLRRHGDTALGAAWPNEKDRQTRFSVMLDVVEGSGDAPVVLCDFGCGTGELLAHIRNRGIRGIDYVGVDRLPAAIALARTKFPGEKFLEMDVHSPDADLASLECDYLVANGVFTVKRELTQDQMWSFLESTIRRVWPRVRRGIAFNVMSKAVDWERDDLFHVPMDDIARLLHGLAGRSVRFRADYGLYEYTAYAFKEGKAPAVAPTAPKPREGPAPVPVLRPRLAPVDSLVPYLRRIDASRIYSNHGPLALELQERIGARLGLPSGAVTCATSGTAALVGAILAAAGRASNDRPLALLPGYTFVATASASEQCGYLGYLADVDPETWMLDPGMLLSHPELRRVGVVVPASPFGRPVPQAAWRAFRETTGIPVVIDGAAELDRIVADPGASVGEVPVALSFHATKSFSTGEGGAVVSSILEDVRLATQALNFGFHGSRDSQTPSTNGKISEYAAAVGLAELDLWAEKQAALRAVAEEYRTRLAERGLADRFFGVPAISSSYALFLCGDPAESESVQAALRERSIDFRFWYGGGLHRQTHFSRLPRDPLPVTESLGARLLGLPVAPDLAASDVRRVAEALAEGAAG